MRIALMHRRLRGGGTEADLRLTAAGLAARGHDVHVYCARADADVPGVTVHRVPTLRGGRLVRLLSFAWSAPRAVARERFDVVVGFGRTPRQDIARIGGGTHRSYLARMEATGQRRAGRGPYHRAILWIEGQQFAPGGHRRVLAVSRRVADEVMSDYAVPWDHVAVIYNGVDTERFHPGRRGGDGRVVRERLGVGDAPICLALGTGFVRKGFDRLLALWAAHPPNGAHLVIVGDDERRAHWARQAAPRVHVVGPQPDPERWLAAATVLVAPSRQEAFGNVVLEACAAGVPVVTTSQSGAAELLSGPLAELVLDAAADAGALRAAILRAIDGVESYGAAARALAERHPWSVHLDAVERLFHEVAAQPRHGAERARHG